MMESKNGRGAAVRTVHSKTLLATVGIIAALMSNPPVARSVDGLAEINETCAAQTGCFSGDTPGYPITIDGSAGRSYRLTSDLIVPDSITTGIVVFSSDIAIDLNHFTIIRSGCEGSVVDCTPSPGVGEGVATPFIFHRGISLKNGSIVGMGGCGVCLGDQAEVSDLRVRWNRGGGIDVAKGSSVSNVLAYENGSNGILAGDGSSVAGNTSYSNLGNGIKATTGSHVSNNTAYSNGLDGIVALDGTSVSGNTVRNNGGVGLDLSAGATYRDNTISSNTTGTVSGGVDLLGNSCNGATTCP